MPFKQTLPQCCPIPRAKCMPAFATCNTDFFSPRCCLSCFLWFFTVVRVPGGSLYFYTPPHHIFESLGRSVWGTCANFPELGLMWCPEDKGTLCFLTPSS